VKARALILPAALFLSAGCLHAEFIQTDPSVILARKASRPRVYIDRLPERPYRSAGILELTFHASLSLRDVLEAAGDEGKKVGCDVVIDRSIHLVQREGATRKTQALWRHAQYVPRPHPPPPPPPTVFQSPPPGKREFICGIWEEAEDKTGSY
jgi:hypothetical protein